MSLTYRHFFGMSREAFPTELAVKDIRETPDIGSINERFHYALRVGAVALVTGEVGSGKSTAIKYVLSKLHPSEYKTLWITACSGSILEFYRLFLAEMGVHMAGSSKAIIMKLIKNTVREMIVEKKMRAVLIVDEASLMRLEVFAEIHTLCLLHSDAQPWLPMVLVGGPTLIDKLMYQTSRPLASRVVARSHMEHLTRPEMEQYLSHHLGLAGVTADLFDDTAVTAIHQGSGGSLRKANHLARGALIAAANKQASIVTAEHVRLAATEIF
jgi:type II secretory pathway predicted ATPase ExeA